MSPWFSPAVVTAFAALMLLLERLFPQDPHQRVFRPGFWTDLVMYGLVQSWILGQAIARLISWMDSATGLTRLHLVSGWPVALQLLFFLIEHDLYIYWFHRWQHRSPILWRTHEAHHSGEDVDWLAGTRSHPLEILINQTIEFAPIVLLGAAPEVAVWKAVIDACWGMWIHSNIGARTGVLQYVINGPEMHRWHHAAELPAPGKNFGTKLAIWDWIFGTAYRPEARPAGYGLGGERFPSGYVGQTLHAFRRAEP